MADDSRSLAVRCISVFKDLLSLVQAQLLNIATDPERDGSGLQEVSDLSDAIVRKSVDVTSRGVTEKRTDKDSNTSSLSATVGPSPTLAASAGGATEVQRERALDYTEALRDTVVFAEVAALVDRALEALGVANLYLLIDEWTAISPDVQPYVAEFIKRALFPSKRITVKIASLEYRSSAATRSASRWAVTCRPTLTLTTITFMTATAIMSLRCFSSCCSGM